jgi:hypothetical protein
VPAATAGIPPETIKKGTEVKTSFAFAASAIWVTVSFSADALAQTYPVRGTGTVGCGTYIEWRNSNNQAALYQSTQWVWGYLHGYNMTTTNAIVQPPDDDTVAAYLEKFCRDNPLKAVAGGVPQLIEDLGGSSARARPKK